MSQLKVLPPVNWKLEGGGGRQPAGRINDLASDPREQSVSWTARGALLPINYGRRDVVGLLGPQGKIGSDLVIAYIWGIGPIDAIEGIYLNDEALPGTGVSVTHYLGTPDQGVDPWLASAVAGYNDRMRVPTRGGFRGVAYSVLRITTAAAINGFPRARAIGRWLANIRDPRNNTVGYSANSALVTANYIEDPDFGLDSPVVDGLDECADWADSLLGGILPRCRIGISLSSGRASREYADLLAEYAECFYVEEGVGFRMIPDAPVDLESTPIITASQLAKASLSLESASDLDSPTEITVQYTQPGDTGAQPWAMEPTEPSSLPGVAEGTVTRIPTSVSLEGVNRYEEAKNKCDSRLARQSNKLKASWRGFDAGVLFQPGDVVRLQSPQRGVELLPVRITNVSIQGAGRHNISAINYDPSHYPNDLVSPGGFGVVPPGVIAILSGGSIPDGWEAFNDANGKMIRASGPGLEPGSSGGANTISQTIQTTMGGDHNAGSLGSFYTHVYTSFSGGSDFGRTYGTPPEGNSNHQHGVALNSVDPQPFKRIERLVVKSGLSDVTMPSNIMVFGAPNLSLPQLSRVVTSAGRLLSAGLSSGNSGSATRSIPMSSLSASDAHTHYRTTTFSQLKKEPDLGPHPTVYDHNSGGGNHAHSITLTLEARVKRMRLPLWGSGGDYRVIPGMIFFLAPGFSIPDDFLVCDGTNGTPNVLGEYVEISGVGVEYQKVGDNTLRITGNTNQVGHSHRSSGYAGSGAVKSLVHTDTAMHDHSVNETLSYSPEYFCLLPIMYVPGV